MEYGNDNEQFGRLSSVLSPDGSERDIPKAARIKQNLDPSTLTGGECTMYKGGKIAQIGRFFCLIWLICLIRERYKFRFLCFLCEQKERGIVWVCAVVLRHAPSLNLFI